MQAVAHYLAAVCSSARTQDARLPLLPHQVAAFEAAWREIDAIRPGFAADLATAIKRQPDLRLLTEPEAAGLAAAISAAERVRAERDAELCRRAEHEALAPVRARLLGAWDRTNYMEQQAKPVEEGFRRELAALAGRMHERREQRLPRRRRGKSRGWTCPRRPRTGSPPGPTATGYYPQLPLHHSAGPDPVTAESSSAHCSGIRRIALGICLTGESLLARLGGDRFYPQRVEHTWGSPLEQFIACFEGLDEPGHAA